MTPFQIAALALIQGITEFLPISSHAHLILGRYFMGLPESSLNLDVAVHLGTLVAVVLYFWRDVWFMVRDVFKLARGRLAPGAVLAGQIVVATLPVVAAGFALNHYFGDALERVSVVAWTTLGFGLLLYVADHFSMTFRRLQHMTYAQAFFIGCAQVLALAPGVSRSGITMTAARLLGYERAEAARFSLLMSIPAIIGAGTLVGIDLAETGTPQLHADLAMGALIAFVSALIATSVMMRWLERATFLPFVIYRIALGGGLLVLLYAR